MSLGLAISGEQFFFINNTHKTNIQVAEMLLQTGANPNEYCYKEETSYPEFSLRSRFWNVTFWGARARSYVPESGT